MNPESSPFRPGQLAPVECFVGRSDQIEQLRGMVRTSKRGRFKIGFLTGERGIGKSSLASLARWLAECDEDVAGCHVHLGGVQTPRDMLRRTYAALLNDSMGRPWHTQLRSFFGSRVRGIGMFGMKLELELGESDLAIMERNFVAGMKAILAACLEHRKALFLILDDINGLAGSEDFADWLKSAVDQIGSEREPMALSILVVGLEERRQQMMLRQPSVGRIFELADLAPWSPEEVREFYRSRLAAEAARVSPAGLDLLAAYTGGLPVLAHEIGDAIWRTAGSPDIRDHEIRDGIFTAAEIVGMKFLRPQVFSAIRSGSYHSIFRKMADKPTLHVDRAALRERLSEDERKVLDNFLRRMTKLGALAKDPEVRGRYRFPNSLHALYFWMESERRRRAGGKLRRP